MSGTAIFTATSLGAAKPAAKLGRAARELRSVVLAEFRGSLSKQLGDVFRRVAPYDADERDSTHLVDELEVRVSTGGRITATVHSPVRSPQSGYAYTNVTRFGHAGPILPTRGEWLRWKDGRGWHRARSTAGHHPGRDWVEDARPGAEGEAAEAAARIGRVIQTRLL